MKKVRVIRNQGKSVSNYTFDTKAEALHFINSLPKTDRLFISRLRTENLYVVGLK